jgi:hypothetical protein
MVTDRGLDVGVARLQSAALFSFPRMQINCNNSDQLTVFRFGVLGAGVWA